MKMKLNLYIQLVAKVYVLSRFCIFALYLYIYCKMFENVFIFDRDVIENPKKSSVQFKYGVQKYFFSRYSCKYNSHSLKKK